MTGAKFQHLSKLLVVDDDARFRERLSRALTERGKQVFAAANCEQALALAANHELDGAVTDLRMPGASGLQVVEGVLQQLPECRIVVLTGYGSIASAVEAMRLGALDYLVKPCSADQVLAALEQSSVARQEDALKSETPSLAKIEREHIERVLVECGGNVSKAARVLGINRRTLQYKQAKYPVIR